MADFATERQQLAAAQTQADEASAALAAGRLALARLERQRRDAVRHADGDALDALDAGLAGQRQTVEALGGALDQAKATLGKRLDDFVKLTDPRDRIGELSDEIPILLIPLRIETRFKAAPAGSVVGGGRLWVRAYPDDIAIDGFEPALSEAEITRAQAYWTNIWIAGGDETGNRGAWKGLASAQGTGRAWFITQSYTPLNAADFPAKVPGTPSVTLVFATKAPLAGAELAAVKSFWEAVWRADGSRAAVQAALTVLVGATSADRAAEIQKLYAPANLDEPLPAAAVRATVPVTVAQIVFAADADVTARTGAWTTAPRTNLMPDRLVLLGYNGDTVTLEALGNPIPPSLQVAPDPSVSEADQTQRDGDEIRFEDELAWLADFQKAVAIGMGFDLALDPLQFRRGFDKLLVLGLRLAADPAAGQQAVETLFTHHHQSRGGFSIVPQGQPTNNVEGAGAAFSWREDPDVAFDHYFGTPPAVATGWFERSDGDWLATSLGLKPSALGAIPFYTHGDVADAKAMNTALWPATLGYYMDSQLDTVFDDATIAQTRDFFVAHVSGRGTIPAIRVGRQPYGILPATPRSRLRWLLPRGRLADPAPAPGLHLMQRVYGLLRKVETDWEPLLGQVAHIGKAGDQHQILLDVVGLHPASVEFYQRYAESLQHLYNRAKLDLFGAAFWSALAAAGLVQQALDLLAALGWARGPNDAVPDLLEKLFLDAPNLLKGDLIDDRPLSESDAVRAYTAAGGNYLRWLIDAAGTSHDALRKQEGFKDGVPGALLYLMTRHALDLSFVEVSRRLFLDIGLITDAQVRTMRRDSHFLQVKTPAAAAVGIGSRWDHLYRTEPLITGSPVQRVADYIPTIIKTSVATAYLSRQLDALKRLEPRPTAALERLFVEHLDLCSYRLDAWYGGLMSFQLAAMRDTLPGAQGDPKQGIHLGAFGWVENLRSENKVLTPVALDGDLAPIFEKPGDPPLTRDSTNAGYIHTPSLNQAVTAAILRNGYLSNATPADPGSLAINLSSERVRFALGVIEGMREGQGMAALLGYEFERGLHDRHDVEVDSFIYDLRKAFPLGSDRIASTKTGDTDELGRKIDARDTEARNVIDGLGLVEAMRSHATYPFGKTGLPSADPGQAAAINAEAKRIANIADAVADLAMAESVHQVAQGNYERAGANLDTFSKGKFPPLPDVISTPRSGVTLTHRIGLHLKPGIAPGDPANISPRAQAEPALNAWLAGVMPPPARVAARVTVADPVAGTSTTVDVTQADLKLASIDLLYLLDIDDAQAMRALDDAIELFVRATPGQRADATLTIDYRTRLAAIPGHVPLFELAALTASLRALLLRSRPLRASDMGLAIDGRSGDDQDAALDIQRAVLPRTALDGLRGQLDAAGATLQPLVDASDLATIATTIDADVAAFAGRALAIAAFAHPEVGAGGLVDERWRLYDGLRDLLGKRIDAWAQKRIDFNAAITAFNGAAPADDDAKFIALYRAEIFLLAAPSVRPPAMTPAMFLAQLTGPTLAAFDAVLLGMTTARDTETSLGGLYTAAEAARTAIVPHDTDPLALGDVETGLLNLAGDLATQSTALAALAKDQIAKADVQIAAHGAAPTPKDRLEAAQAALEALFGDAFVAVPEFTLAAERGDEWAKAWGAGPAADTAILDYLVSDRGRALPVDDWSAGAARVREKLRHLETGAALGEALGGAGIDLQPLQFPYHNEDYWLALEFPKLLADGTTAFVINEDKLLYTAHYAVPFAKAAAQCGLLVDEWTEVIPARSEDTGLAFHFDRPNTEPPQTLLLALPSNFTGAWTWDDLVDTVHETMDLTRKRAIEPGQIDQTPYGRFLPALVSATTLYPITASLNLAFNNGLAGALLKAAGEGP